MRRPVGIHVDERGIAYVTDTLAHRVYLFELQQQDRVTSRP
jgi:sugar lactone lactonase YvrE